MSLSKSSAIHIFNKYLHISPIEYTIHYRLEHAATLLQTTESSINLITNIVGFDNVGYFCRKFKELYNVTPSEYRKIR